MEEKILVGHLPPLCHRLMDGQIHTYISKTAETEAQPNVGLWKQRMVVLYWCVFGVGAGLKTEKQKKAQNNQVKGFFLWWWRGMVERMIMGVGEGRC